MKLRAPDHISGPFSHKGRLLEVAEDLCVDVPEHDAEALAAHGFLPAARRGAEAASIDGMTRDELVARVMDMTAATLAALSTEDLRVRLRDVAPIQTTPPDESRGAGVVADPDAVSAADIELMSRVELFAFLRAHRIATALPIRNDELRARARAALLPKPESD